MRRFKLDQKSELRTYAGMPLFAGMPVSKRRMEMTEDLFDDESILDEKLSIRDDRGVGVVELILILVVLIALVAIFKTQLTSLVNTILSKISTNANKVMK